MIKAIALSLLFASLPVQAPKIEQKRFRFNCDLRAETCIISADDLNTLLESNRKAIEALQQKSNCGLEA
jgi:hypothetical protein